MRAAHTALLAGVTGAAGLAARYAVGRAWVDRSWRQQTAWRLADVGQVAWVSILPLVERLSPDSGLRGEPGVAYLVRTRTAPCCSTARWAPAAPPQPWTPTPRRWEWRWPSWTAW